MRIAGIVACAMLIAMGSPHGDEPRQDLEIIFAWDLDPSHVPVTGWEVEVDETRMPCGQPTVTSVDRRCRITLPLGDYTFRLRAAFPEEGDWSSPLSADFRAPGLFTVRAFWEVPPSSTDAPTPVTLTTLAAPNNAAQLTITHDGGAGEGRCLTAAVRTYAASSVSIASVMFGGVELTRGPGVVHTFGASNELAVRSELWTLVGPPAGTHVLAVTATGNAARLSVVNTTWVNCGGVSGQSASLGGLFMVFDLPVARQHTGSVLYGAWAGINGRVVTAFDETTEIGRVGGADAVQWAGFSTSPQWGLSLSTAVRSAAVVVELRGQ